MTPGAGRRRSAPGRLVASVATAVLVVGGLVASDGHREGPPPDAPSRTAQPLPPLVGDFEEEDLAAGGWRVETPAGGQGASVTESGGRSAPGALLLTGASSAPVRVVAPAASVRPGVPVTVSGFARVATGSQEIGLQFLDHRGTVVSERSSDTGPATSTWTRVEATATAPSQARTVRVRITAPAASRATWDDVGWGLGVLPDGHVEDVLAGEGAPRGWTALGSPAATVRRSADGLSGGGLELSVPGGSGSAAARSRLVSVPPGAELEVHASARTTRGAVGTLALRWLAADGAQAGEADDVVSARSSSWVRRATRVTVPDGVTGAVVEVTAAGRTGGSVVWDEVDLAPAPPQGPGRYRLDVPTRAGDFVNAKTSLVVTVRGRPKVATVLSGAPAQFQLADLGTGEVEARYDVPGVLNGWGLTAGVDGRTVWVGGAGVLWRYDTLDGGFTAGRRLGERAEQVFDLVTGPDGRLWAGTYPGGEIWSLDPRSGAVTPWGVVGDGNDYARSLAVDSGWLYVGTGPVRPGVVRVSTTDPAVRSTLAPPHPVQSGLVTQVMVHGTFLTALFPDGRRGAYDLGAGRWAPPGALEDSGNLFQAAAPGRVPAPTVWFFREGRVWIGQVGARGLVARPVAFVTAPRSVAGAVARVTLEGRDGIRLLAYDGHTTVRVVDLDGLASGPPGRTLPAVTARTFSLDLRPTSLRVKALATSGSDLLVGGYGGSSLSLYDGTSDAPLSRLVGGATTPKYFGEVEGSVRAGRYQYLGTYPRARIFRLDTTRPWRAGANPRLVADLGTPGDQDRPIAWAADGQRAVFGTIPKYGVTGGVLGWFGDAASEPQVVDSPVPHQSVVAVATSGSVVYGGTSRWGGLGTPPDAQDAGVFAYDTATRRTVWRVRPEPGAQAVGAVLHDDEGRLWAATRTALLQLDPRTGRTLRRLPLSGAPEPARPSFVTTALAAADGHLFVVAGGSLLEVDPVGLGVRTVAERGVSPARLVADGSTLYYPATTRVVRVRHR